jgi:hypothetical protein
MTKAALRRMTGTTWVPDYFLPAHELCLLHHDVLVELLRSGEEDEHVCGQFATADPVYLADIERRMMAATLLWAPDVDPLYRSPALDRYVEATRERLKRHCVANGHGEPTASDLLRMKRCGAFPGESRVRVALRNARYPLLTLPRRARRALGRYGDGPAKS